MSIDGFEDQHDEFSQDWEEEREHEFQQLMDTAAQMSPEQIADALTQQDQFSSHRRPVLSEDFAREMTSLDVNDFNVLKQEMKQVVETPLHLGLFPVNMNERVRMMALNETFGADGADEWEGYSNHEELLTALDAKRQKVHSGEDEESWKEQANPDTLQHYLESYAQELTMPKPDWDQGEYEFSYALTDDQIVFSGFRRKDKKSIPRVIRTLPIRRQDLYRSTNRHEDPLYRGRNWYEEPLRKYRDW